MAIGTTAAILGASALGAGAGALSSRASNRSAAKQAEAQRDFIQGQTANQKALEDLQLGAYRDIYLPQLRTQADIYNRFASPVAQTEFDLFNEGAGLQRDIFNPNTRTLSSLFNADLSQPLGIPPELADRIFGTARQRISQSYSPLRQRASERLAGAGLLDSGVSNKVFQDLDQQEASALEDEAFKQALAEFDISRSAKQQQYSNLINLFGVNPRQPAPNFSMSNPDTSEIGAMTPYLSSLYTPIPSRGINPADVVSGAVSGAQLAYGLQDIFGFPSGRQIPPYIPRIGDYSRMNWGF